MVNPDRVAFTIFGKDIYWYGVLMAIGILIAIWLAPRRNGARTFPRIPSWIAAVYDPPGRGLRPALLCDL